MLSFEKFLNTNNDNSTTQEVYALFKTVTCKLSKSKFSQYITLLSGIDLDKYYKLRQKKTDWFTIALNISSKLYK